MNEKKPFSLMILIFIFAMFCSYHIYYYVIDKTNDSLVRNYSVKKEIENNTKNVVTKIDNSNKEEYLAILEIPKIDFIGGFYSVNSNKNNVNENITLLKESTMPDTDGSIIYLAAHSGTGHLAYFNNIDKLNIDDIIKIKYHSKLYSYSINDIYEMPKNGSITINRNIHEKYLVLTTCSKHKGEQLVITSKLMSEV